MTQGESSRARASVPSRLRATRLVATRLLATLLPATLLVSAPVLAPGAQATQPPARGAIRANGEELVYLRALSLLDTLRDASMLIQPFSAAGDLAARAVAARVEHPWMNASPNAPSRLAAAVRLREHVGPVALSLLPVDVQLIWNSALPVDRNDGVLWAGRGATIALQGGIGAEWRWLRAQLAPVAFGAQNAGFALAPNGRTGSLAYGDARFPNNIDAPQRFGSAAYGRLDWGDSFIEASGFGLTAGLSNARQQWGPAREYPLVLSTNSGGFTHGHLGTAVPLGIGIGRLHLKVIAGRLEQSDYSSVQTGQTARFLSGAIGSFSPTILPGLELGAIRIANGPWGRNGLTLSQILRPFQGIINDNVSSINQNDENQFAALFFRLSPPGSGFEAYGELSREDFAGNWRWLMLEPDDLVDFVVGVSQARVGTGGVLRVLRLELVNGDVSHQERMKRTLSGPIPPYTHSGTPQGLTNRGQLLGSPVAYGGGGGVVAWDRYDARGRITLVAERAIVLNWLPAQGISGGVRHPEVRYGLRAEVVRSRGDGEWGASLAPSVTLNRNIAHGNDLFNLNVQMRWRGF